MAGIDEYLDVTVYPIKSSYLTLDGVQYSPKIDTAKAETEVVLFEYSFEPPFHGDILWAYFLIGANFQSLINSRETVVWRAQVRTVKRDWVNLFRSNNVYTRNTAWKNAKMEGYARAAQASFSRVRFDIRVLFRCSTPNGARGRLKNNTMFRVVWLAEEAAE